MKTIAVGIVAMLGLAGALHAQKGERKGGDGQLLDKLDANGDGVVSKQEWLSGPAKRINPEDRADARFAELDKSGDGELDKNEWSAVRGGKGHRHGGKGGAKGRNGAGKRGAQLDAPGQGKGRPGPGGAGRGAGGGKAGGRR